MEITGLPAELEQIMEHHGHLCFGVLLGYKACQYAVDLIGESKNITAETENGSCGDDAVRVLLNCTEDNGRLVTKKGNRQSWSFYNPEEEEGVRLLLNPVLSSLLPKDKDQAMKALIEMPGSRIFMVEPHLARVLT